MRPSYPILNIPVLIKRFSKLPYLGCLLVFLLCGTLGLAQIDVTPVSVTDGDGSYGKSSPRVAVNSMGQPVVFWHRTGNEAFFVSTLTDDGFSTPTEIDLNGINPNLWGGSLGPNIAAGSGHMYVTFEVYGEAIYIAHSADDGNTWDTPVAAFTPPMGRRATIPTIGVDGDGQPLVAYVNTNASEGDAYYGLVRSDDFGTTWSEEANASAQSAGEEVCECCNGHVKVAPNGDVFVGFRNNENNLRDMWLARSTDGGLTFENAWDVDETDWVINACPTNGPHFDFQGDLVMTAFYSGEGSAGSGAYVSSFDLVNETVSASYSIPTSDASSSAQNRVRVAASEEAVAAVWQETFESSMEIGMTISYDGIDGLQEASFLLTDEAFNQRFPDITWSGGFFHVVYDDSNANTVMYVAVSENALDIQDAVTSAYGLIGPNPCINLVEIRGKLPPSIEEVTLVDMVGRSHLCPVTAWTAQAFVLNTEKLASGVYMPIFNDAASQLRIVKR